VAAQLLRPVQTLRVLLSGGSCARARHRQHCTEQDKGTQRFRQMPNIINCGGRKKKTPAEIRQQTAEAGFDAVVRVRGGVDVSPRSCTSTLALNPAQNGKRPDPKTGRPLTMVAGARYAQRCPMEFGAQMEVVIAV